MVSGGGWRRRFEMEIHSYKLAHQFNGHCPSRVASLVQTGDCCRVSVQPDAVQTPVEYLEEASTHKSAKTHAGNVFVTCES